jgi:hypothetical protein
MTSPYAVPSARAQRSEFKAFVAELRRERRAAEACPSRSNQRQRPQSEFAGKLIKSLACMAAVYWFFGPPTLFVIFGICLIWCALDR